MSPYKPTEDKDFSRILSILPEEKAPSLRQPKCQIYFQLEIGL